MKFTRPKRLVWIIVGASFLVIAIVCQIIGAEITGKLPNNFSYKAAVVSNDNLFDEGLNNFKGVQSSLTDFTFETVSKSGNILNIHNIFDVKSAAGEQIVKIERDYKIDQNTGRHANGDAYLFAPKGIKEGENYVYRHINYDRDVTMEFAGKDTILGLPVYRYEARFDVDQTKELANLPEVGEKYGIILHVKLVTWIEPNTGMLINYQDKAEANYYDKLTNVEVKPWNHFSNTFNQTSISEQVARARQLSVNRNLATQVIPGTFLVIAVICFILAFLPKVPLGTLSAFVIPVVGVAISLVVTYAIYQSQQDRRVADYELGTAAFEEATKTRIQTYVEALYSTRGFYLASDFIRPDEWKQFTDSLNLQTRFPGIQGIGLSLKVGDAAAIPAFERLYREILNSPGFTVYPQTPRDEYHSVVYIEPLNEQNKLAIGFDMSSESVRNQAMILARDTGEPILSGKVTLVQDESNPNPGFLLYMPLYSGNVPALTAEARASSLLGYTYAPFRASDFFGSLVESAGDNLAFKVYSQTISDDTLLYSFGSEAELSGPVIKESSIDINGQTWRIQYFASSNFVSQVSNLEVFGVLLLGLIITGLITSVVVVLRRSNKQAYALAENMTSDMRKSQANMRIAISKSLQAEHDLELTQQDLIAKNQVLEENKAATLNILEDLDQEKTNITVAKAQDEAVLQAIGDALVTTDSNGKILLVNKAFEQLIGVTQAQVLGKRFIDIVPAYDDSNNAIPEIERPAMQVLKGKPIIKTDGKILYEATNKRRFPASLILTPIIIDGKVTGAVEIFRDVTREKEIDKAKSEFVSLASHQLRTPLTSINWFTEMLLAGDAGDLNEKQRTFVTEVSLSSKRMSELVGSLLNASRIDMGTFSVEPEPTNIVELAKSVVKDIEPKIFEKKIDFKEDYETDLPIINVDPKLTRMMIENLASNAVKYTPESGTVTLSIGKKDNDLLIAVKDTGFGIPKVQQPKIFSKLFRADNVKEVEGTGLGLYIIKSIIDYAQGKVWFESVEGKGSTFYVQLPLSGMVKRTGVKQLS